ncbi:methyl-accepting chemotaxis protein [Microbulbifer magnicolonia]|uniref:methyl-accepting chemotaxis protein n=1 Tax=Microbulbifer magnicolonia TaxID=3109744 RepID=UPI002B40C0F1|nr:methyl-accepting chemotaxis protein [Microbulbifer sp. GG15]
MTPKNAIKRFKFHLQTKVLLLALVPLFLVTATLTTLTAVTRTQEMQQSLDAQRQLLIENRLKGLENLITAAATAINDMIAKKKLSAGEAQRRAQEMLRAMRFEGDNYIFVYDFDHIGVVTPNNPASEGEDASDLQSADGVHVIREVVKVAQRGGGQFQYRWSNLNTGEVEQKYSFVAAIPEWRWAVGAGVYMTAINNAMTAVEETAQRDLRDAIIAAVATGTLSFALVACIAVWLVRRTVRPIRDTARAMEDIAKGEGDLTRRLEIVSGDEVGELATQFNAFVTRMQETMRQVRASTRSVHMAASNIARGSEELATRTEQAAASLQETSASMEEITATVNNTSDAAQQATELAGNTASVARSGEQAMSQVERTMADISSSSGKIGEIIGLIDGIAFQTNILALNASVEAARAGDHGRGFAVVAQEVRTLASRSADAARDIRKLIDTSVKHTQQGSEMVRQAGSTMQEIVTSVTRVADVIEEISSGAREQSGGIGQINTAVTELDSVTQQNATMVQQTSTAAGQMRVHADRLKQLVSSFILGDDEEVEKNVTQLETHSNSKQSASPAPAKVREVEVQEWAAF